MDVYNMYVGDCSSTFRTNMFRDYEKHPYGTFEGNHQQQPQRKSYYTMVQGKSNFFHVFFYRWVRSLGVIRDDALSLRRFVCHQIEHVPCERIKTAKWLTGDIGQPHTHTHSTDASVHVHSTIARIAIYLYIYLIFADIVTRNWIKN